MIWIKSVTETTFKTGQYSTYEGYVVVLSDDSEIKMGIRSGQSCCEDYGYLTSQEDFEDFIGAEFHSVSVTDAALCHYDVPSVYDGNAMFITLDTSEGTLQFVAYNEHNGYYSHEAVLIENGTLTAQEYL